MTIKTHYQRPVKILLLVFAAMITCSSDCSKEDQDTDLTAKTSMISSGNWFFAAYTADPAIDYDGDGTKETDLLAVMSACQKDNYYVFNADGSGEFNYGVQKCGTEPQSSPYHWSFIENGTSIKLDNGNVYFINQLTEDRLTMTLGTPGTDARILTLEHR